MSRFDASLIGKRMGQIFSRTFALGRSVSDSLRTRSLLPREHGAYAQIGVPLTVAIGLSREPLGIAVAGALSLGFALIFLLHEPVLVLLGHRGKRVRKTDGGRAQRLLALLSLAALPLLVFGGRKNDFQCILKPIKHIKYVF